MAAKKTARVKSMTALVPLALVSAAWTASLVGPAATTVPVSAELADPTSLPDGSTVPAQAIEAPASVSGGGSLAGLADGLDGRRAQQAVSTASSSGIPSAALAAYQRAETVINAADKSCNLPWQLVAAIGRVESNHGQYAGNTLDADGVAQPGIYGIALNGRNNTEAISDTDAGELDNDTQWDRAVGPMQFIPSTWRSVGVDADGDGRRDPQDVDDAALGTAVYLCSGSDDLSTTAGQEASVFRYNRSDDYVQLVLSIMDAYTDGDYTSVPSSTTAAGVIMPDPDYTPPKPPPARGPSQGGGQPQAQPQQPQVDSTPQAEDPAPTTPPKGDGGPTGPTNPTNPGGGGNGPQLPVPDLPDLPETGVEPVDDVLTVAQAIVQCTLEGLLDNPLSSTDKFDQCVEDYTTP
ncbi:lytic murein transglycosylase [Nocardioides sp. P86]|uniref:lytic transglycosylase domain-containing protein n=1 Tax=Nocardioides sp. P86 TaxID=2939569 RepID=UPI00203B9ABE|nr:lytic murein transglycosylase [Nocardioides sp. P86]MCM3514935.1 lytic murein transglycosylase [Nocardioides sp. P86]